jgi:hypothetical protein
MKRRDLIVAGGIAIGAPFVLASTRAEERSFATMIHEMNKASPINKLPHQFRREIGGRDIPMWTTIQEPPKRFYPPEWELSLAFHMEVDTELAVAASSQKEQRLLENLQKGAEDLADGRHVNLYVTTRFGGWRVSQTEPVTFGRVVSVVATWDNCLFTPDESGQYFRGTWSRV